MDVGYHGGNSRIPPLGLLLSTPFSFKNPAEVITPYLQGCGGHITIPAVKENAEVIHTIPANKV
ncbi:MAG: hypothetical protein GY696_20710 [Gammaproteobacteria bacterium]|nr:hypothetical protein [Gammaproteobacteria bacterium]